ncbi:hypothetical protein L1049_005540 [Liquidambar formosana]|uniref:C3H1-type domain-containing protein n=1 Tax=Liquidambar formosana TaxID=63359 RepID=A0AAP0WQ45_LIQFO
MQKDISSAHGGINFIPSDGIDFTSLYSSIFSPNNIPYFSTPVSLTPSDCSTDENTTINSPIPIDNTTEASSEFTFAPRSRFIVEHQDLVNRHNLCINHLREAAKEAEALRRENTTLRIANRDLNKRLSLLVQASLQKHFLPSDYTNLPLVNGFRDLRIGDKGNATGGAWDQGYDETPAASVIESDLVERVDVEKISLPKSISVRSNGYLKGTSQGGMNNGGQTRSGNRLRTASQLNGTQKVYVRGSGKKEEALELEVYNQGMSKTELCNKWQETGTCPYGDHCQFAHGIEELRPVIRHPRYKTEVCRMVLAGDPCPYGHRCHFRHALTDQEKLMGALNPRAMKMER